MEHGRSPLSDNYGGCTHAPVPWCSKLLASNHVEWRPIIVCWKLQHLTVQKYWSVNKSIVGGKHMPTLSPGANCAATYGWVPPHSPTYTQLTHEMTWGGEHNVVSYWRHCEHSLETTEATPFPSMDLSPSSYSNQNQITGVTLGKVQKRKLSWP